MHYAILKAVRIKTSSRLKRFLAYEGNKLEGLSLRINDFEETLGPGWDVSGEITSEMYFEMRLEKMQKDERQWSRLTDRQRRVPLQTVLLELYCQDEKDE
jgi:hypothetical protein